MRRVKVRLTGSGTGKDPFRVNLPTYVIDAPPDYGRRWAWVLVPDDEVTPDGRISQARIRKKYREGWDKFDAETVKPIDLGSLGPGFRPSLLQRIRYALARLKSIKRTHA